MLRRADDENEPAKESCEVEVVGFVDLVLCQKSSRVKIWSAFILSLTASLANKIELRSQLGN